jgi:energy-coupling factor transporter ATP-binding protein EcfA2
VRDWLDFVLPSSIEATSKILLGAFVLCRLLPVIPQAHLLLVGPQGSGKSRLARALAQVLDPSSTPLRRPPRDERELYIGLHNRHVAVFDNVRQLPSWLADALCAASSGAGFAVRRLYSDAEEVLFHGMHGAVLTSIGVPCCAPDFLDRALLVELRACSERRSDLELDQFVTETAPYLLGALLRALHDGLKTWDQVCVPHESQMRLFDLQRLLFGASSSPFFGWSRQEVDTALQENRRRIQQIQLDMSPTLGLLIEIAQEGFRGTASELLARLAARAPQIQARRGDLPRSPEELGRELAYLEGDLRAAGVIVERRRGGGKNNPRLVELRMAECEAKVSARRSLSLNPSTFSNN